MTDRSHAAYDQPLGHSDEGPWLRSLTDRLVATPQPFLRAETVTEAVLRDGLELVLTDPLTAGGLAGVRRLAAAALPERLARHVAVHLLTDASLRPLLAARRTADLLDAISHFSALTAAVPLRQWFGDDPERHEEVVRALLRCLALRPRGETHTQAEDRWQSVSTSLRSDALRLAALEQARADALALALADKRAQEAAAQYSHV
ncbi:MAG: hypothetical protein ABI336_01770 [Humibacillus sp.]